MLHATSSIRGAPASQYGRYGADSTAILATSRLAAAAGPPKAGAGSAEDPAKLCCCKGCTADRYDILDLKTHYLKDKGMYSAVG
jgi:hypothetical protein